MSDTGSGETPTTPRWAGVHRPEGAEPVDAPLDDPTPSDAWGARSFSPYDVSSTPDYDETSSGEVDLEAAESGTTAAVDPVAQTDAEESNAEESTAEEPTDTVEQSEDESTEVMAPVSADEAAPEEVHADVDEHAEVAGADAETVEVTDPVERNPLGIWAAVTGVLLIFPAAIVLGHLGLRAAARERRARTAALAGLLLGYLGLVVVAAAAALWLLVFGPQLETAEQELQAQADVTAVGNAVAAHFESSSAEPELSVTEQGYRVDDAAVEALLEGDRELSLVFDSTTEWCVELTHDDAIVSYVGASGYSATACG